MREGEVTALGNAFDVIKNRAKANESVNKRALIQTSAQAEKLESAVLATLAMKIGADPFAKASKIGAGVD